MHLLLTDRLVCPRCGPEFGLILLASDLQDRLVLEGALGCANCREQYPVEGGYADLRLPPRSSVSESSPADASAELPDAMHLAALVGVREGPAYVLLLGEVGQRAPELVGLVEGVEAIVAAPAARSWPEQPGVSRAAFSSRLPLRTGSMRAVAASGSDLEAWIDEGVRVLQPLGRLIVITPSPGTADALEGRGLSVLARDARAVVAQRSRG